MTHRDWSDPLIRERLRNPRTEADILLILEWFRSHRDYIMQRAP